MYKSQEIFRLFKAKNNEVENKTTQRNIGSLFKIDSIMDDAGPDREKFKCVPDKWSPSGWKYKFGEPSNNVYFK